MLCDPLLIYIKGKDKKVNDASYICTFLQTIAFLKTITHLENDRILFHFPRNPPKCKKKKYESKFEGQDVPEGICVIQVINKLYNELKKKCLPGVTPILFIFDGHGYVPNKNVTIGYSENKAIIGNMVLDSMDMDEKSLLALFEGFQDNPKMLIFTQCGSNNLLKRCHLANSIIVSSTDKDDACAFGVKVLYKIENLLLLMFTNKNKDLDFFVETLRHNGLGCKKQPKGVDWPLSIFFTRFEKIRRFVDKDLNRVINHPIIQSNFEINTILRSINTETKKCLVRLL